VPDKFTPIGGISVGYSTGPPRDFSHERKPISQTVYRGRWSHPPDNAAPSAVSLGPRFPAGDHGHW